MTAQTRGMEATVTAKLPDLTATAVETGRPVPITSAPEPLSRRRLLLSLAVVIALAFIAKVTVNVNTFGSTDALLWESNLGQLRDSGALALYKSGTVLLDSGRPYHSEVFNHPPFMIHLLRGWGWLAELSGLPLRFWMRFTCAVADLASILMLLEILRRRCIPFRPAVLLLAAASPVSLMISGFHGNTDPIMLALLVLSVFMLEFGPVWVAGAALGLAMSVKIVPLLFVPAMFLFLRGGKRLEFFGVAAAVFGIGSLPMLAEDPLLIWNSVFGYRPQSGIWGVPSLILIFGTADGLQAYLKFAKIVLLSLLVAAALLMNVGRWKPPLLVQFGLTGFLLLAATPGFGVQYLSWLVPWTCLLRFRQALVLHAAAGVFLFTYYTRAAQGFPWYLANSAAAPVWNVPLILVGLICWGVICAIVISFGRRLKTEWVAP